MIARDEPRSWVCWWLGVPAIVCCASPLAAQSLPPDVRVARLVGTLGAAQSTDRETATLELQDLGPRCARNLNKLCSTAIRKYGCGLAHCSMSAWLMNSGQPASSTRPTMSAPLRRSWHGSPGKVETGRSSAIPTERFSMCRFELLAVQRRFGSPLTTCVELAAITCEPSTTRAAAGRSFAAARRAIFLSPTADPCERKSPALAGCSSKNSTMRTRLQRSPTRSSSICT